MTIVPVGNEQIDKKAASSLETMEQMKTSCSLKQKLRAQKNVNNDFYQLAERDIPVEFYSSFNDSIDFDESSDR